MYGEVEQGLEGNGAFKMAQRSSETEIEIVMQALRIRRRPRGGVVLSLLILESDMPAFLQSSSSFFCFPFRDPVALFAFAAKSRLTSITAPLTSCASFVIL